MKLERPKFYNFEPGAFPDPKEPCRFDVVELKYDGWWGQLLLQNDHWKLYSRTGQLKKKGTLLKPFDGRTLLHGEFCYGTEWAKDNPQLYNRIAVYGAEMLYGKDVRHVELFELRRLLNRLIPRLQKEEILNGCFLVDQWPLEKARAVWEATPKFEGLVFKDSRAVWGSPYGRMKRGVTMDYICLGFEQSESDRHAGWGVASVIGGLVPQGQMHPVQVCRVSGLDDTYRRAFYDNPDYFIGKVFEASGKKVTKSGALRHPNFVRWREDKSPNDCVWPAGGSS